MMKKETLLKAVVIFFGVMVLFTLLSRAVYQSGTAAVRTALPTRGTIDHSIRVTGKTSQNQDIAVITQPGLRVGAVMASEGQQVKAGDVLFLLDMDYLEEKITTQTQELRKQQLSVQDAWSQNSAMAQQRANAKSQAEENYDAAVSGAEKNLSQAETALDSAQKALDDYYAGVSGNAEQEAKLKQACQEAEAAVTQAQSELTALEQECQTAIGQAIDQANTGEEPLTPEEQEAIKQQVEAEYAPRIQTAQQKLSDAQTAAAQARQALDSYTPGARPTEQELLDALEQAKQAYEQASDELDEAKRTYGQAVQTASLPGGSSNSAQIGQITYDQMAAELQKLEALRDGEGKVLAPADGVVTACYVRTGQMTSDTTALLLADTSQGWKFTAELTQEQSKYIGTGDQVTLRLESSGKEYKDLPVIAFSPKESGATITVSVPSAEIPLGAGMELSFTRKSQGYACCVPLTALHMDARNQPYILTVETVNTVLGKQTQAVKVAVTVLDKNDTTAALEAGGLGDKPVIVSADRAVDSGSRVRVE